MGGRGDMGSKDKTQREPDVIASVIKKIPLISVGSIVGAHNPSHRLFVDLFKSLCGTYCVDLPSSIYIPW